MAMPQHIRLADKCHNSKKCQPQARVKFRGYIWRYTPKRKYGESRGWTVFWIPLCEQCYLKTYSTFCTHGWDWWDACDGLCVTFFSDEEKYHCDNIRITNPFDLTVPELSKSYLFCCVSELYKCPKEIFSKLIDEIQSDSFSDTIYFDP